MKKIELFFLEEGEVQVKGNVENVEDLISCVLTAGMYLLQDIGLEKSDIHELIDLIYDDLEN